ncbi:MAG: MucR family transcriptional regulator [Pseudonocardiales bacterium]|nr:MucR family transcriptional regulator [Pseudonocardiales bacterium]MBV9032246.1 MucR family transcriptional regulator [Pseudonocardiales bacterium]
MTSTAVALVGRSRQARTHVHLWSLPDGTGLHAPYGQLVIESGTGRVCCHLCGRWYVSLGGHLRTHGHTADSYREKMGLCRSRPLVAEALSRSIATRQSEAYQRSPALRARLAVGQELSKTGRLATLASAAHTTSPPPELTRLRRAALDAGRMTRATQRDRVLARRLRELGFEDLAGYLRHAYSAGASLRGIAKTTGLGWIRLRRELEVAGIAVRPANLAGDQSSGDQSSGDQPSCVRATMAR